jgi:hypothetical protein
MLDILFLMPRPNRNRAFVLSGSIDRTGASVPADRRDRSLPLLFDATERVELSLEAVVRMLLGLLEKIELLLEN